MVASMSIEVSLWFATSGTICTVVPAISKEDAKALALARLGAIGKRPYSGRVTVKPCTPELYAKFEDAMTRTIRWEPIRDAAFGSSDPRDWDPQRREEGTRKAGGVVKHVDKRDVLLAEQDAPS